MSETNYNEKEPYIGSVRFYKQLILSTILLIVLLSICVCVFMVIRNYRLQDTNQQLENQVHAVNLHFLNYEREMEEKVADLEAQIPAQLRGGSTETESAASAQDSDWQLVLINDTHPLTADYQVKLSTLAVGQKVDSRIQDDLNDMLDAMENSGLNPFVCSGYRDIEKQQELFTNEVDKRISQGMSYEDAFFKAKQRLGLPGSSEHHTGLAVDIVAYDYQILDEKQEETAESVWLAEHCGEYGFILRYPEGKTDVTGYEYEAWHFRYVGKEAAEYIMAQGITLEEYLEILGN